MFSFGTCSVSMMVRLPRKKARLPGQSERVLVEHRGDEAQLAAVALDPLAAMGSGGGQRLLAVGVHSERSLRLPFDERTGP